MKPSSVMASLVVTMFTVITVNADGGRSAKPVSAADQLFSSTMSRSLNISREVDAQACHSNDTAVITIYSTNGIAHKEIDVRIDGSRIGSLTTYFPDGEPGCKSPSAAGVITIMVPAGKHTLEAESPNITWPSHNFSVNKCECMVLPLS